jgi:hypothetical protein
MPAVVLQRCRFRVMRAAEILVQQFRASSRFLCRESGGFLALIGLLHCYLSQGSTTGQDGRKMVVHTVSELRDLVVSANKAAQASRAARAGALAMVGGRGEESAGDE